MEICNTCRKLVAKKETRLKLKSTSNTKEENRVGFISESGDGHAMDMEVESTAAPGPSSTRTQVG